MNGRMYLLPLVLIALLGVTDVARAQDEPIGAQWALERIGFDANLAPAAANPIIVAVIDSGLDYYHPDLAQQSIWANSGESANGTDDDGNGYVDDVIGWNFIDNDNNPWDLAGHGTHVSGLIAHINPGARVMPLRVLNFMGRGRSTGIAEAIYYATKHGARIINLSLGGQEISRTEERAIDYAHANNVLVIVAAGNEGIEATEYGPAGLDNVITVGATGEDDKRASFSNWGPTLDISAPGIDVVSLRARYTDFTLIAGAADYAAGDGFLGEQAKFYRATGTSFAAPIVTGIASLLISQNPQLSADDVKRVLLQNARDAETPGVDQYTGYGIIDARAALAADPAFFIETSITGVAVIQLGARTLVRATGTADADRFDAAWLELGRGEDPSSWQRVTEGLNDAVRNGTLGDVDTQALSGATQWTLRVITKHKNGRVREARFALNLGS